MPRPTSDESLERGRGLEVELLIFLLLAVLALALRFFVDPDLGGHLAYGLDALRAGSIARSDPYSYTASGLPWVNHEWAFEWMLARVYTATGTVGLGLVELAGVAAGAGLVLGLAWRSTRDLLAIALLWVFYLAILGPSLGIRPQLATYVLFPILLLLVEKARTGRWAVLLWVPPMFALWANLHGGFVAGLGLLGAYAAGSLVDAVRAGRAGSDAHPARLHNAIAICVSVPAAAAATLLNPWGSGLWRWLSLSLGMSRPQIVEWQPLQMNATGVAIAGMVAVAGLALIRSRHERIPLAHAFVLVATLIESLTHARHAPFFAASVLAFVPGRVHDVLRAGRRSPAHGLTPGRRWLIRVSGAMVIVPLFAWHAGWPPGHAFRLSVSPSDPAAPYPTGAFVFMEKRAIAGDMVVWFDWAQMVIFRYAPRIRVAYDGRFRTVYPADVERTYFDFISGAGAVGWNRPLTNWPTDWVLLPADGPATDRMRAEPGWWLIYEDDTATLFEKARAAEAAPDVVRRAGAGPILAFERVARPRP